MLPSETGRSVMKSTPRCDQGRLGTGSGRSLPDGRWPGSGVGVFDASVPPQGGGGPIEAG